MEKLPKKTPDFIKFMESLGVTFVDCTPIPKKNGKTKSRDNKRNYYHQ